MNDQTYLLRQNERLFEATLDEFSKKPFALASTNEIIKQAEYNKGSFYYRFKTKEEIYIALIDYVYIQQLALFERQHIRISTINSVLDIITLLFDNLTELHQKDPRYVLLLRNIYRENEELKDYIRQYCVSSFLDRILEHTTAVLNLLYDSKETKLLVDFLLFSYYNEEIDFRKAEMQSYVSNVSDFLTKKQKHLQGKKEYELDFSTLDGYLNFVLMKESMIKTGNSSNICFLSRYATDLFVLKEIRQTLKIQKIDLEHIITSGIKRNLKDYTHLLKLAGLPFYQTSFHQLRFDQKIVLLITYFVLIGNQTIVIDYLLKFIQFSDIQILFEELLPILSKTSTIIVIEEEFYTLPVLIGNLYQRTKDNTFQHVDLKPPQLKEQHQYEIKYLDTKNIIKTIQKSEDEIHMEDYYKYRFITLNAIHKIRIQDIV